MDIVKRLRAGFMGEHILTEAADEIERLRQQVSELVDALERICSLRTIPLKNRELRVRLLSSIDIAKSAIAKATGGE